MADRAFSEKGLQLLHVIGTVKGSSPLQNNIKPSLGLGLAISDKTLLKFRLDLGKVFDVRTERGFRSEVILVSPPR